MRSIAREIAHLAVNVLCGAMSLINNPAPSWAFITPAIAASADTLEFADRGKRTVEIRSSVPMTGWAFTVDRGDTPVPPRPFVDAPPAEPPAAVRAIR